MTKQHPVYTLTNECKDCYKCVRHCPVKAIKIENDHASVIAEKCISCGHCVQVCPTNAKCVRTDLEKVKNLFKKIRFQRGIGNSIRRTGSFYSRH